MVKSHLHSQARSKTPHHRLGPAAIIRKGLFAVAILGASSAAAAPQIGDVEISPASPTSSRSVFLSPLHSDVTGLLVSTRSDCSGGIFRPVSQPIEYVLPVSNGWNYFFTRTTNDSGEGSDCVPQEVLHDDQSPTIGSLAGPSGYVSDDFATIQFSVGDGVSGSGVASTACRLNMEAWDECSSPLRLQGLEEGENRLEIRAVDFADNISDVAEFAWSVDLSNPTVSIQGPPDENGLVRFTGNDGPNGSGIARFVCSLNERASVDCVSPYSVGISAPGSHSLTVMAIDNVGRTSAAATVRWVVAEPPPPIDLRILGISGRNDANVDQYFFGAIDPWVNLATAGSIDSMKVMIVDHAGKRICAVENLMPQPVVKFSNKCLLRNGKTYTAMAEAVGLGNKVAAVFDFVVDTEEPEVVLGPVRKDGNGDVFVSFDIKDATPIVSAECILQGSKELRSVRNCRSLTEMRYKSLSPGNYIFSVTVKDSVGLSTTKTLSFNPARL